MRTWLLFFIAGFLLVPSAQAQNASAHSSKYWIFFHDKRDAAGKTTVASTAHLTDHARERRQLRGSRPAESFDAPLSPTYLDVLQDKGITPMVQSRWLNAVSVVLEDNQIDAIEKLGFVHSIRPVASLTRPPSPEEASTRVPPPPANVSKNLVLEYGPSQTQLEAVNAIPTLENGINGAGVILGFLDSEYGNFEHPAFAKLIAENRLLGTMNFTGASQPNQHGRSVASLAVGFDEGNLIGPAYGASVLAATTEYAPTETNQEEDNFVRGLEWLEAQGVDVVNVSLGYNLFDAGQRSYATADLDGDTAITTRAVDIAAALGVVVVTSAGNEGTTSWRLITTPADADSVITVGSVRQDLSLVASSGRGPTADGRIKPDVVAMGSGVWRASTDTGYSSGSGTSFSSPIVAGVVCQMLQVNPRLNPIDVRDILHSTASRATNPDNNYGWGVIDAEAAVLAAQQHPTAIEDPTLPSSEFQLGSPYPNPFSSETVFEFRVPANAGAARLSVYNLLGQRVDTPFDGVLQPGLNRFVFHADDLPPGLYLYTLHGERVSQSGKMVLVGN